MASTIKIKNNGTAGVAPTAGQLVAGELALNRADGQLYYLTASNSVAAITDTIDGGVVSPANLLLLHFDGNSTDSSTYARTITAVGNATTSTAQKKFGTHSALFDGSGDRFDVPSSADFNLGGTDHTIDFWMWVNTSTNGVNERLVVFEGTTQTRGILIGSANKTSLEVNLFGSSSQITSANGVFSNQTWTHVALVRSGSTTTLYVNGTSVGSTTSQCLPTTNSSVSIGGNTVRFADSNFNGYIDEVRIANTAIWTGNFTPPTSAYSQSSGSSARTQTMKVRGGTAATLAAVNPTPAAREPVYETDSRLLKVGDGITAYNSLGYVRPQVTATDRLLGRSSAGAGAAEEITCTSFARTLLDDTDAATARTTLGVAYGSTAGTACQGNDGRLGLAAWVNFDGTATSNLTGTYTSSGTTITVTCTAHGFIAGQIINLDFTSGTAVDLVGTTVATVANANTFTVTGSTSVTTSGNVSIYRNAIKAQYNVSSIVDLGVGLYAVNFSTALSSNDYAVVATASSDFVSASLAYEEGGASTRTVNWCRVSVVNSSWAAVDRARVSVAVYR